MTNKELYILWNSLNTLNSLKGARFAYAIAKNKAKIRSTLQVLEDVDIKKKFIEYSRKIQDIDVKIREAGTNKDLSAEELNISVKELEDKKLEIEKDNAEVIKSHNELLDVDSDVELHKIKKEDIPEDITVGDMEGLLPLIEDE